MPEESKIRCATRADVAKRAGVSVTVVSYVLNNNRYVEKEKRARVLQAARELHYTPNNIARALKGKSSHHIIFIVDNTTNERFGRLVGEMDRFAYEKGSMVSLCANRNNPEFIRQVIARRFDGVIISSISFPDAYIREFVDAGIPVVLLQSREYPQLEGVAKIGTGLYHGAQECVRYFYNQGRRHILYIDRISKRNHFSDMSDNRYRGFIRGMEACGLESEGRMITGCTTEEEVQRRLADYMQSHPVDAILGRNDRMACVAMKQVLHSGRRVPEDVGIIGYDDSSVCKLVTPSLTSMKMQEEKIAQAAVEMLYEMQTGSEVPETRKFSAQMVVRRSTDPSAAEE
ncbi:LacI family DNA-binding transcriptional regulator [Yanshouia hominis]|uniref:LacI family DNA-binding transcriptional regulator n=1 Tax=Yanshouia hominis TaxID=2763673 RepID=A0ABR7NKF4_9FIRM|nr:LacI family DNA-binding transcriptional regulator [Yanshouia hominis]MBC8576794.1 LacI family DNA-binding transcriptional regulator [Yanshouia hominis]